MLVLGALAAAVAHPAVAADAVAAPASADAAQLNLLIVNLMLDGQQLTDTLYLYESGNDVLVPVGELARLLTIGVTVDPANHVASGFLLNEGAPFRLDPAGDRVILPGGGEAFDPRLVRWIDGELYVSSRLLQRWWPVDFKLNLNALSLEAIARQKLPIQLRLDRQRNAARLGRRGEGYRDPGYPRVKSPYRLLSVPMIDSTIGLGLNRSAGTTRTTAAYSGVFAGDLLGMEAMAFLTVTKDKPTPDARVTLSRFDPDGGLLGPIDATSVQVGNVGLPALRNVLGGGGVGWGSVISNRPLNVASSYGLQTLRGELPPGWDVTLFFNDALIAFAQSRGDGLYEFPDQPLVFGRNEFRLVFNGPLGQRRVETQVYVFDQTVTPAGKFYYTAGARRDGNGAIRSTLQMDAGIAKGFAVTAGSVHIANDDGRKPRTYVNAGVRAALLGALVNVDHAQDVSGGSVTEVGLRTAILGTAFDATRTWISGFTSDVYTQTAGALRLRDQVRVTGAVALSSGFRLPYAVDVRHDQTSAGIDTYSIQPRLSVNVLGTSFTNALNYQIGPGPDSLGGTLQASRRVAGIGVSSQIAYTMKPASKLQSFALSFDRTLGVNNRLNLGVVHSFGPARTTVTAGMNRNFGPFAIGVTGLYGGRGNVGAGLQLFTALGRNPRGGRILNDWQPMAGSGAVAAKVFVDGNMNGRFDAGEEPIANAGFRVNGNSRQAVRTDARGEALLSRLPPRLHADVALDPGTLEDAQWQPVQPGARILPRSGKVQTLDFPVVLTAEIDGTVYLKTDAGKRGIGNATLQLVDATGRVAGEARSSSDGYYIVPSVKPGTYTLRIEPEQLRALGLTVDREARITVNARGDFVSGIDFQLSR